jgi:hypothetical protein
MKELYSSWCKYCGEGLDKKPVKTGNCCLGCRTKRARLYSANHPKKTKKNVKTKRPSRSNTKGLSRKQK